MTPTPDALKVHWKLPLKTDGMYITDSDGRAVCTFAVSSFSRQADYDHANAFINAANGGLLEKCFAMAMEIDRLKDELAKERPKYFVNVEEGFGTGYYRCDLDGSLWWVSSHGEFKQDGEGLYTKHIEPSLKDGWRKAITAAQAEEILKGGGR